MSCWERETNRQAGEQLMTETLRWFVCVMWHFSSLNWEANIKCVECKCKKWREDRKAAEGMMDEYVTEWCHCATGKLLVCCQWQCADCSVFQQCLLSIRTEWSETKRICISWALLPFSPTCFPWRQQTHIKMLLLNEI